MPMLQLLLYCGTKAISEGQKYGGQGYKLYMHLCGGLQCRESASVTNWYWLVVLVKLASFDNHASIDILPWISMQTVSTCQSSWVRSLTRLTPMLLIHHFLWLIKLVTRGISRMIQRWLSLCFNLCNKNMSGRNTKNANSVSLAKSS